MTRALVVGVSILAGVLAFVALFEVSGAFKEVDWRAGGIYRLDPELGYFHRALSSSDWVDFAGNHELAAINSMGLRGAEIAAPKKGRRIILLGDSMVFGHGVRDDETLASRLEELLRRSEPSIEVINAGVKGYGIDQEFKLLKRVLKLSPDVLIWFLYSNDFGVRDSLELELYDYNQKNDQLIERDVRRSFFYLSTRFMLWLNSKVDLRFTKTMHRLLNRLNTSIGADRDVEAQSLKFAKFTREFRDLARSEKFIPFLFVLPDRQQSKDLSYLKPYSALPLIDLNHAPEYGKDRDRLFLIKDSHLSREGNDAVARLLVSWLSRQAVGL